MKCSEFLILVDQLKREMEVASQNMSRKCIFAHCFIIFKASPEGMRQYFNSLLYFSSMMLFMESVTETVVTNRCHMDRVKRIWYLSPMRAAKVQASLRIRAVSPEPSLLAHTSSESRGTFRQKARSQAPLNGWACAVKICHDGMLENTNSLDGAHIF